jgi:hypothetical protein
VRSVTLPRVVLASALMDITPEDPDVIRKVLAKLDELSQRLDRVYQ